MEARDEARSLRYLAARLNRNRKVSLVGNTWDPDVKKWNDQGLYIPRQDLSESESESDE